MNKARAGTAFDLREWFSVEDVARAFIFDLTGRYVPSLESKLTPIGKAYHDWIDTIVEAIGAGQLDYFTLEEHQRGESGYLVSICRSDLKK